MTTGDTCPNCLLTTAACDAHDPHGCDPEPPPENEGDAITILPANSAGLALDYPGDGSVVVHGGVVSSLIPALLAQRVRTARDALRAAAAPGFPPLALARAQAAHDALTSLADAVPCPTCGAPAGAELGCDDCP